VGAVRPEHRAYLRGLGERLVVSGPTDAGGAVLIFETPGREEVEAILDGDPMAREGLVTARAVHGWTPVLGRWAPADTPATSDPK
jgi:uncharacterized protein YciI